VNGPLQDAVAEVTCLAEARANGLSPALQNPSRIVDAPIGAHVGSCSGGSPLQMKGWNPDPGFPDRGSGTMVEENDRGIDERPLLDITFELAVALRMLLVEAETVEPVIDIPHARLLLRRLEGRYGAGYRSTCRSHRLVVQPIT